MSADDRLLKLRCRDCGLTSAGEDYPDGWVSEKSYEAPQLDRCPACWSLHRGAMARVEANAPPPVTRKRIFVASPFRGANLEERIANLQRAERYCRMVVDAGFAPFAPHVHYPGVLDEDVPEERAAGIACGMAFLETCSELWQWGESPGVLAEVAEAHRLGIVVRRVG